MLLYIYPLIAFRPVRFCFVQVVVLKHIVLSESLEIFTDDEPAAKTLNKQHLQNLDFVYIWYLGLKACGSDGARE